MIFDCILASKFLREVMDHDLRYYRLILNSIASEYGNRVVQWKYGIN